MVDWVVQERGDLVMYQLNITLMIDGEKMKELRYMFSEKEDMYKCYDLIADTLHTEMLGKR